MVIWYILCKDPPFWLCDNLEEWDGVGDIRGLMREGHMCSYGWSMLIYGRHQHSIVIILQVRVNKGKKIPI